MRLTTFVYPWDLARLGVERTLEQLVAEGFDGIHLASTYHPIDRAIAARGRDQLVHEPAWRRALPSSRGAVRQNPAVDLDASRVCRVGRRR